MSTDPSNAMGREWPWIDRLSNGRLELSFDAPLNKEHRVDWLKVRDWLAAEFGAVYHKAFEFPTFEWYADFTARGAEGPIAATLFYSDFPDELTLRPSDTKSETFLHEAAERLRSMRPDLGSLQTMDGKVWREWLVSLGAPDYSKDI